MRRSPAGVENAKSTTLAFSRLELLACISATFALLLLTLPSSANTRGRTQRAGCVDNLRQIGQAVQLWAVDQDNMVPWRVPSAEGGTKPLSGSKSHAAWVQFAALSNSLVTPKSLACPSDELRARNAANSWSTSTTGGLPIYRNNAVSYTVGLHASLSEPISVLSSDRNLRVDSPVQPCVLASVNDAAFVATRPTVQAAAWTNAIHGLSGNILMTDGRVSGFSTPGLRSYLPRLDHQAENGIAVHLLMPY